MYKIMEKNEVRSLITKRALSTALKKLMSEKPLQTITISDITNECGYHRQTFYYHFADMGELLKWTFDCDVAEFLSAHDPPVTWQDTLRLVFKFLDEKRAFCLSTYYSLGRDTILKVFHTTVSMVVYQVIADICNDKHVSVDTIEFLTTMTVGGIVSLVEQWLIGDLRWSSDDIVNNLSYVADDIIAGAKQRLETYCEETSYVRE